MRTRSIAFSCLLAGLLIAPQAWSAPRDVVADYFKDGRIDQSYSVTDLRGALVFARRHQSSGAQYAAFADAINQAITDNLVGAGEAAQQQLVTPRRRIEISPPPEPTTAPAPVPAPAPAPIPSNLPAPPQGSPAESIPWVVPTMAIAAALLLLGGIGSSIWRRMRR